MKCNEARRMVVPFVKKELPERDTEAFLAHIETCEDCMDELDIYFIAYHALNAMDQGTHHEYDFKKMLHEEIRSARRNIIKHKIAKVSHVVLILLAEFLLAFSLITGVRMKQGLDGDTIFERAILRMYMQQRDNTAEELEDELAEETESRTTNELETKNEHEANNESVINNENEAKNDTEAQIMTESESEIQTKPQTKSGTESET
ncbi:MAG: zf-HC2 domain-containing protein [Clostridiales bacterium]|nr:zf-HC2 domain-containing protein [Clostridiales bacterium]